MGSVVGSGLWVVRGGCCPTQISANSPYFIDDRVNKIANTNITDHRSHVVNTYHTVLTILSNVHHTSTYLPLYLHKGLQCYIETARNPRW